jgi:hypothetical protein
MVWGGDPVNVETPDGSAASCGSAWRRFPIYRLAIIAIAAVFAVALWMLLDRTRLGAMIRAGVDDPDMARVVGIRVSQLFTIVFALGRRACRAFAGIIGGPILSVYPGPRSGHAAACAGRRHPRRHRQPARLFVGSIIVGFIYNFGQALLPELAYFVLFLPMLLVLIFRPQGLFGRHVHERDAKRAPRRPRRGLRRAGRPALLDAGIITSTCRASVVLRHLRARPEHPGWLRRTRIAGSRRTVRASRLCHRLSALDGFRHTTAIIGALAISLGCTAVFAALALRATGIGFIMITLALGRSSGARLPLDQPSPAATTAST